MKIEFNGIIKFCGKLSREYFTTDYNAAIDFCHIHKCNIIINQSDKFYIYI